MPLVSSKELLMDAKSKGYALCAFNAENLEMAQAVVMGAQHMRAPVIVQTTPGTLRHASPACFVGIVSALAQEVTVPVALHLDHGNSVELAQDCMNAGYTSLMIDGSGLPYEDNISLTKCVSLFAGDIPLEAELGTLAGKEDGQGGTSATYTDPSAAADFMRRSGAFSLAVSIGTAHGVYKGEPHVDIERLRAIHGLVEAPLVLHGGTGLPDTIIRACINNGIRKVNFATDLRLAFTAAVRLALQEQPQAFDPKMYLARGREAVMQKVTSLIRLCGAEGKA